MGLLKEYRKLKSLQKGAEPALSVSGITALLVILLKIAGVEVTEDNVNQVVIGVVASASGLYGAFCTVRNWLKNRKK